MGTKLWFRHLSFKLCRQGAESCCVIDCIILCHFISELPLPTSGIAVRSKRRQGHGCPLCSPEIML